MLLDTLSADQRRVRILDQTRLPLVWEQIPIPDLAAMAHAIRSMQVRGAPLIGVTAAYGLALALSRRDDDATLDTAIATLARLQRTKCQHAQQRHRETGVLVRRQRQLAAPDRHDLIGQLDEFGRQRPRQQLDAFAIGIIVIAACSAASSISIMPVSISPGAMQLTVILRFASSVASALVAPMIPAFAAL